MAQYKITENSIKVNRGITSFRVTFYDDDNNASEEQYYEVHSTNENDIYEALDRAAENWNKANNDTIPSLITNQKLDIGTRVEEKDTL